MINLQHTSGLPLLLNTQDNTIHPAGEITFSGIDKVKLEGIRPILLNRTLRYPADIYWEYRDICLKKHRSTFKKNKLHYSIIVLPPGLLGIEYNKSHIFSPDKDQNEITAILDILYGNGIVLIQRIKEKRKIDVDTGVNLVTMFRVNKGDRIPIPQKYMYTFINPKDSPLIVGRIFEDDGKIDYRTMRKEHGMSYYFIRKNARQEVVRNPHYKTVPDLNKSTAEKFTRKYRLTSSQSIYSQFIYNEKRFRDLLV